MAGLTASNTVTTVFGDRKVVLSTVTFDDSYPTGGEAVTAALFGLGLLTTVIPISDNGTNPVAWDGTNSKLLAYVRTTGVEVANAVDLSASVTHLLAIGF